MKKILIVGPSWVGDMVMAQALFRLLKQGARSCQIHVLAPEWTFSLLKAMPEVEHAIEMPIKHGEWKLQQRHSIAKRLRNESYDQAIILPNSFKAALIPWLAKIPQRTGWRGEFRYGLLNDMRLPDEKRYPRMIDQYLALGLQTKDRLPEDYPRPKFSIRSIEALGVAAKHKLHVPDGHVLAICAGAEFGSSKRWPWEYYAEVALKKLNEGWTVWLFGSPKDRMVTDQIMMMTQKRCVNIAGQLQLHETIHLLSLVDGVVTNDSGLMHVAAALEKPLIAIYGSTSDQFTPPLAEDVTIIKQNLPCQPCFKRECPLQHHYCMRGILPSRVIKAMQTWSV